MGDARYGDILKQILIDIFGKEDKMRGLVEDHAKSRWFQGKIAEYYEMKGFVRTQPHYPLQYAKVFEAWFAAFYFDRSYWGGDFEAEARNWLEPICRIRYRSLLRFATRDFISWNSSISMEVSESIIVDYEFISYPKNPIFKKSCVILKDQTPRNMGWLARIRWSDLEIFEGFHFNKKIAEERAHRSLQNHLRLLKTDISPSVIFEHIP